LELEEHLARYGLALDVRVADWPSMVSQLEVLEGEGALVLLSLSALCEGGLDLLMDASAVLQGHPQVRSALLVEPSVRDEMESVRLMTHFRVSVDTARLGRTLAEALGALMPGLQAPDGSVLAPPAPPPEGPRSTAVVREIATSERGDLSKVGLGRVLYSLYVRNFTGTLVLRTEQRERSFMVKEGEVGGAESERAGFLAVFSWMGGSYEAKAGVVPAHFVSFGPALRVIYEGYARFISLNHAATRLAECDGRFPLVTRFLDDRREALAGLETLQRFCALCNGTNAWNKIIATSWRDIQEMLKVACYALDTDLVVLEAKPVTKEVARVQYTTRSTLGLRPRNEAGAPLSRAARPRSSSNRVVVPEAQSVGQLRSLLQSMERKSPSEIFNLQPGCGGDAVRARFYEKVKIHHPDVHGGSSGSELRSLAEEVFLKIKGVYQLLLEKEGATKAPPAPPSKAPAAGAPPSKDPSPAPPGGTAPQAPVVPQAVPRPSSMPQPPSAQAARSPASPEVPPSSPGRPTRHATATDPEERTIRQRRALSPTMTPSQPQAMPRLDGGGGRIERPSTPIPPGPRTPSEPLRASTQGGPPLQPGAARVAHVPGLRQSGSMPALRHSGSMPAVRPVDPKEAEKSREMAEKREALSAKVSPDQHYRQGDKFLKANLPAKAREAFKLAAQGDEKNRLYRAYYAWASFLADEKEADRSRKLLEGCVEGDKPPVDALVFLARILKRQGLEKEALAQYKKVATLQGSNVEAQRELRLYEMRKKEQDASKPSESFFGKLFQKKK
jgi:hypothetical protein